MYEDTLGNVPISDSHRASPWPVTSHTTVTEKLITTTLG